MTEERTAPSLNLKIFGTALVLISIGVAFMYGASASKGGYLFNDRSYFFHRQLIYGIFSILIILFLSRMKPEVFFKVSNLLMGFTIVSLILVLIPGIGVERNGARRWIDLGIMNYQPSELAKISVVIYLTKLVTKKEGDIKYFTHGLLPLLLVTGLVFALTFVEEDFSTAVLILIVSLNLIFVAGASFKHYLFMAVTGAPILFFLVTSFGHMKARLNEFLKTFLIDNYVNFQVGKGLKAIEQASIFGSGLGIGSYYARIPEAHTDFIFPSIVADIGLFGGFVVILLFLYLFMMSFKLSKQLSEKKYSFLVFGITLTFVWQTIVNLTSVLGLIPTTGVPLPFLSFGGNSLISNALGAGIILSLARFHLQNTAK